MIKKKNLALTTTGRLMVVRYKCMRDKGGGSPPEQLFFLFGEKRVVWVSCLPLFSIYRKEFSCDYSTWSVVSLVV